MTFKERPLIDSEKNLFVCKTANKVQVVDEDGSTVFVGRENDKYKDLASALPSVSQATFTALKERPDVLYLPDTSDHLLQQIRGWADRRDRKCIFWLNGGPKSGKTTIARIVAREFHDKGCLAASFFFSSGDTNARHLGKFIPSIAVQLTKYSDVIRYSISDRMLKDDGTSSMDWHSQWNRLIWRGLYDLSHSKTSSHQPLMVIVIDALDECKAEDHDIQELLHELSEISSELHAVRLRFFITGRPSNQLRTAFGKISVTNFQSVTLDDKFMEIMPCEEQLSLALDCMTSAEAQTETRKEIYSVMVRNCTRYCRNEEERAVLYSTLREILSTNLVLFAPVPISALAELIERRRSNIMNILLNLRPVLKVAKDQSCAVSLSLGDFLTLQGCSDPGLRVDETEAHGFLAQRCIQLMLSRLQKYLCGPQIAAGLVHRDMLEDHVPAELRYACCYWVQHLYQSNLWDKSDQIFSFLQRHFLHWFEALALLEKTRDGIRAITLLESMFEPARNADLCAFISYMKKFAFRYHSIAEEDPLQIYASTITFPRREKSKVQRLFKDQVPTWLRPSTNARDERISMLYQLKGHSDAIMDVAFCCDGRRLASSSRNGSIRIWYADTGELIKSLYFGTMSDFHGALPFSSGKMKLALSADGKKLASVMAYQIVQLDTVGCQTEQEFIFEGDTVALSPDGSQIALTKPTGLVLIWESSTGQVQQILDGDSPRAQASNKICHSADGWQSCHLQWTSAGLVHILSSRVSAAVSGDGSKLAVAGCRSKNSETKEVNRIAGLIRMWDPNTGQVKHAFNLDDIQMLDASEDPYYPIHHYAIHVWDISTGQLQRVFHYDSRVYPALAFSPDCNSLAIAIGSHIRLYDLNNDWQTPKVFGGSSCTAGRVVSMKFSPDGSKLISGSEDTTIRLWELGTQQKKIFRPHLSIWTALRQWTSQDRLIKPTIIR